MTPRYLAALIGALALPAAALAQSKASEPASVSQTVDGTKITIEYSRPRARARETIFGKVVKWNDSWTPGANDATTLELSKDVVMNGQKVPKGRYSVWFFVREKGAWTVALDSVHKRWHMPHLDTMKTQIRFAATPDSGAFTDVLTFSFPSLRVSGATLAFQWGPVRLPIDVEVESSLKLAVADSLASRFVGRWLFRERADSAKSIALVVSRQDSLLIGQWEPDAPGIGRFAFVGLGEGTYFAPGLYDRNGKLYEVMRPGMIFQFKGEKGKPATSLELYAEGTKMKGPGKREN